MSNSTIGIKIANGHYYPILEEDTHTKKRLVLTTVKDGQESVQIDLYRGVGAEIADAVYIGSLVIEDIPSDTAGGPEIDLTIHVDEDGHLFAVAGDRDTGDYQSLSISLESLDEEDTYDIPDFALESHFESPITPEETGHLTADMGEPEPERKSRPFMTVIFVVLGLFAVLAASVLIFRMLQGDDVPPLQGNGQTQEREIGSSPGESQAPASGAETQQTENEAGGTSVANTDEESGESAAAESAETASAETASAEAAGGAADETAVADAETETAETETAEAVPPEPEPATASEASSSVSVTAEGTWYSIRWGDTLWDISNAFYRTPWLYEKIAQHNNIPNPDLIYAGSRIRIPEP